ncbi:MAG: DegT/DnrJ/EryC1/StrS family aminotransferase [Nanoarchaeota archaeon]|nr:DegT/DnrJ/EryC1/StrS family aminotransferase [Nanoarchaeota archaeon]
MKEQCTAKLHDLTGKKHIIFVSRGNAAIKLALKYVKAQGKTTLLFQDQGGWITYGQFADRLKLDPAKLKTDHGLVSPDLLRNHNDSALIINSMPAYAFLQDMNLISKACKNQNIFLINDVSGSIGTPEAKFGDLILGSFGASKPIEVGSGGFIATDSKEVSEFIETEQTRLDFKKLNQALDHLKQRLDTYKKARSGILKDLSKYDILNPHSSGINVIIKYNSEEEKEDIEKYCKTHNFKYTLCPRYIRVLEKAVSIEIKQLR